MSELQKIKDEIEALKNRMYDLMEGKGHTDPETVKASQMLDELLNKYNELISKEKKNK